MKWVNLYDDYDRGVIEDDPDPLHIYEDGTTLQESQPDAYWKAPLWTFRLRQVTKWLDNKAQNLCRFWKIIEDKEYQ